MRTPKKTRNITKTHTRREFLRTTTGAAASVALFSARSWAQVEGANSAVRVAVAGLGPRGVAAVKEYLQLPGVRLVALCDVDSARLDKAVRQLKDGGHPVKGYRDYRKLLEGADVDAVSLSTPNHWHALGAIWAIQADKDVYLEAPASHNIWEGRQIVNAARAQTKIVQTGMQCRSALESIGKAVDYVGSGQLGRITIARGLCYWPRENIGKVSGPQSVPETVDYDQWCGPAPNVPLQRRSLHLDWHWIWDTGNGELGAMGIHQMDVARWFLGASQVAPRVLSLGGRLGPRDDGETPNTQLVFLDYPKAPLLFEIRGLLPTRGNPEMAAYRDTRVGVIIDCEHGSVRVPDHSTAVVHDAAGKEVERWNGTANHYQNFIEAVRSRKPEALHADIEQGHISSALCHMSNVSFLLGRRAEPNYIRHTVRQMQEMPDAFRRMAAHLDANEVDIGRDELTLGMPLRMNTTTERFSGNEAANRMLSRSYRQPYIVPEIKI